MLLELNIENFAIIEKLNISFSKGFNVFTGETGAGKSIIIDAMNIVLGGRSTKEFIRAGEEKAVIEALFNIEEPKEIEDILTELGIDRESDNTLLLARQIYTSGRSVTRVNGRTVTLSMLNQLTSKLVDIHGQHEHQSLLSWEKHVEFIDSLGGIEVDKIKDEITNLYIRRHALKTRLQELSTDDMERERKLDLLKFQLQEIDEASLKTGEEEELMTKYKVLSHTEEILTSIITIKEILNSNSYEAKSTMDQLSHISKLLHKTAEHDTKLEAYLSIVNSVIYQLQDMMIELRNYEEGIEYDEETLKVIEDRINLINRLKRKYGNSIEDIIGFRDRVSSEVEFIINSEEEIRKINGEITQVEDKLLEKSNALSAIRKKIGKTVEVNLTHELKDMNLNNVTFKIQYDSLKAFSKNGLDKIEFLISTNPGEPLKPLSKIVSGGEMSRIMLGFKSILAEVDNIPCLIFDEIDTGISGRTAQIVGEKIAKISKTHQVLCVTHLPQIASMATHHYLIDKEVAKGKTFTKVNQLNFNERINELARLLGGVSLTDTTKKHAREMLEMTKKLKDA